MFGLIIIKFHEDCKGAYRRKQLSEAYINETENMIAVLTRKYYTANFI